MIMSIWQTVVVFVTYCALLCGDILVQGAKVDTRQRAPWVAGIFIQNSPDEPWTYLCGGTLTSLGTLITTANCVQRKTGGVVLGGQSGRYHIRYSKLRVLAGLLSTSYSHRDRNTQEREVTMIREHTSVPTGNDGYSQTYDRQINLAGVRLNESFKETDFVKPVMVVEVPNSAEEWLGTATGEEVTLAGFDLPKNVSGVKNGVASLQTFQLTLLSPPACSKIYEAYLNVVCATRLRGPVPCGMEGHGMIVRTDGVSTKTGPHYLMGVYTSNSANIDRSTHEYPEMGQDDNVCEEEDVIFFTKYGEHYRWALSHVFCDLDSLQCKSDSCGPSPDKELCNGTPYCKDKTDESPEVCFDRPPCAEDEFRCKYGACIAAHKICDGNMDCADDSDEEDEKLCREADERKNSSCDPITTETGVTATCVLPGYLGGRTTPCDGHLPVDTVLNVYCSKYFVLDKFDPIKNKQTAKCKRNRQWSNPVNIKCKPDCGISVVAKTPFIVGGVEVSNKHRAEYPWHATIYRRFDGKFKLICGGTLISPNVVLTAAHCVDDYGDTLSPKDHRVFFSKLKSVYSDEDEFTQEIPIKSIHVHPDYDYRTFYADIAVMILEENVEITDFVRPACLPDETNEVQQADDEEFLSSPKKISYGTTVGFGLDETKMVSKTLKTLDMPIIPEDTCKNFLKTVLKAEIKPGWVCGGYTNGSAVCQGDSGGGLVFPVDTYSVIKYYVEGVVSHGPHYKNGSDPCAAATYKVFTEVKHFSNWVIKTVIQETVDMTHRDGSDEDGGHDDKDDEDEEDD